MISESYLNSTMPAQPSMAFSMAALADSQRQQQQFSQTAMMQSLMAAPLQRQLSIPELLSMMPYQNSELHSSIIRNATC